MKLIDRFSLVPLLLAISANVAVLTACSSGSATQTVGPQRSVVASPAATATSIAQALQGKAESQVLPRLNTELAELIRAQPWFEELSEAEYELLEAIRDAELSAKRRGEDDSIAKVIEFAAEQAWYADGLDKGEVQGLMGLFLAYSESLSDFRAPAIGPVLSTTLRGSLFETVSLAESGDVVLLVAAEDPELGAQALGLAVEALPLVEEITGPFPYRFLFIEVTAALPELYAGVSYDEFIALSTNYVDEATVIHELAHSTMYGLFPIWFEEGFAHFLELYFTDSLAAGVAGYRAELASLDKDPRLDLTIFRLKSFDDLLAERAQGLLFLNALYEIEGIEGLSQMVRALRTKTYNDQALLQAIVQQGSPDHENELSVLICEGVIGVRSGC